MNYMREKTKDFYLLDSRLENIFINEYMPAAPGDYIKVFIYASMYAEHMIPLSNKTMADQLNLSEDKIDKAWEYWEEMGAVRKRGVETGADDYIIEFVNLKELLYGQNDEPVEVQEKKEEPKNPLGDETVKKLFKNIENMMGRTLNPQEIQEIISWYKDFAMPPEVIEFCLGYCLNRNKHSFRYISKVIQSWHEKGFTTVDQVTDYLNEVDERYYKYDRIMKALGLNYRRPTEYEEKIMDKWFDEKGYNMDKILEACSKTSGISNPNFNYVDKVLDNWSKEAEDQGRGVNEPEPVSSNVLTKYYNYLRTKAEHEAEVRKEEIYSKIPAIKTIDDEIMMMGAKISKALVLGDTDTDTRKLNEKMETLIEERAAILTEHNYDMYYTDVKYACDKCNDTGVTEMGEKCSCIGERMEEAALWQKRNIE